MIAGLSGPLLSHDAIETMIGSASIADLTCEAPPAIVRSLRSWYAATRERLGPSCGPRQVFDLLAEPLARMLGYTIVPLGGGASTIDAVLHAGGLQAAVMIVTPWAQPGGAWRQAVHRGLAQGTRWSLCVSGPSFRLFDVERAYSRRYAEFSLDAAVDNERTLGLIWGLLRAAAITPTAGASVLARAIALCEQHRSEVRRSLRDGVHEALLQLIAAFRRVVATRHADSAVLDESLVVIYRILFLLFAEARGLVPSWHPVYRDGYTIEALQRQLRNPAATAGIWESLQAIARLAHRGCRAGALRVPPFNGRLFSPSDAPLADTVPLDDRTVGRALLALTTRAGANGPERISYADLGVEQLGSVYEHLLDYDLANGSRAAAAALVPSGRRKATGSFYTPRSLTEFLVRRTLAPLVQDASPDRILALRVLDPAMGSGAFLVAACRFLAAAYEQALVRDGVLAPADIGEDDRAAFRRAVAQKCLFGVDINPMAVQLGRLSLWLATMAADKPLSFLDHRLRVGNSLVGVSIEDILRYPAPGIARRPLKSLPLFEIDRLHSSIESAVVARRTLADTSDDTIEQVRRKERLLASLQQPGNPLDRWKAAADVWCAAWYPEGARGSGRATFGELFDRIMHGSGTLPDHVAEPLLARARSVAAARGFFHWTFEFPEVFYDERGRPLPDGGFDVVVGNPPWEMLRDEGGGPGGRGLQEFVRDSGIYALQGRGHANLYRLFLERIVTVLRRDGRGGLILPAGLASDHAVAPLRRFLFTRTTVDTFTTLDNRDAIFPIHRGLKFLLLTFGNQGSTAEVPARTGIRSADALDAVPDIGVDEAAVRIPWSMIQKLGGEALVVPEVGTPIDLEILSNASLRAPALGDAAGWGIHFGRELNATDDRPHFREDGTGLPVLEGKHLRPFAVDLGSARYTIPAEAAASLLDSASYGRARLGYREVASAANRTTLIAALVPEGAVTTHTIFCLKEPLDGESQHFLCGVFNSYVANYFVRTQVGTHVTAAILSRLPVPKPPREDPLRQSITRLSIDLAGQFTADAFARLNALVASLYGLSRVQFQRVLDTFPLVATSDREQALTLFTEASQEIVNSQLPTPNSQGEPLVPSG